MSYTIYYTIFYTILHTILYTIMYTTFSKTNPTYRTKRHRLKSFSPYSEGTYGNMGSQAEGVVATVCCAFSGKNECVVGTALGHITLWRGENTLLSLSLDPFFLTLFS